METKKHSFLKIVFKVLTILVGVLVILTAGTGITFLILNRTNGSLISSGEKRTYLLYVPESYDPSTPTPLVISIHGYAEWPAHQAQISAWNTIADREGLIIVYPSGTGIPLHWSTGSPEDSEKDRVFISDLIDQLEKEYTIDPARIYANGLSNGGGMSFMLGCTLSERIAAVGSVSGAYLYPWEDCQPTRSVPMIAFHGTADEIVPFKGGPSRAFDYPFPSIPGWMERRALLNGCQPYYQQLPEQGEVTGIAYTDCIDTAEVFFYTIAGGGHNWPGGELMPEVIVGHTTSDINATEMMWAFFDEHALPQQP